MEHCSVNESSNYTYCFDLYSVVSVDKSYVRNAQTRMKLMTGGKGVAGRQNLFVIHAAAAEILDKYALPLCRNFTWGGDVRECPIQPQDIKIMGKNLDSDGNLYVLLPDGEDPDLTPQVDGVDFYSWSDDNLKADKYTLTILAGSITTNADLTTNTPEFCVGQLAFRAKLDSFQSAKCGGYNCSLDFAG